MNPSDQPPSGAGSGGGDLPSAPAQAPPHGVLHGHHLHHGHGTAASEPVGEVTPSDLRIPAVGDYLGGQLPDEMVNDHGRFRPAPKQQQPAPTPQVLPREQVARMVTDALYQAYVYKPETLEQALDSALDLAFVLKQIDPEAVGGELPFHHAQVRIAGYATLRTVLGLPEKETSPLKVDPAALGQELARCERTDGLLGVLQPRVTTLVANRKAAYTAVDTRLEGVLTRAESSIRTNGLLLEPLAPLLAIRDKPSDQGVSTRLDNQKRDNAARADERTRMEQEKAQAQGPAGQTTTVTTQNVPSPATAPKPEQVPGKTPRRPRHNPAR